MSGTIRLFRLLGITVYLHWSWFLVAAYFIMTLAPQYHQPVWAIYEYLILFAIVLAHEFGHALACRSTGGVANRIVLWPLGGVAFVAPPPRPGAYLWSLAAGPLVNVLLIPVLWLIVPAVAPFARANPDIARLYHEVVHMNFVLLCFNLLPVYPLDGGQILRALLWFPFGPIRSLQVAAVIGFIGGGLMAAAAFWMGSIWFGVLAFFVLSRAVAGWQEARALIERAKMPVPPEPPPLP